MDLWGEGWSIGVMECWSTGATPFAHFIVHFVGSFLDEVLDKVKDKVDDKVFGGAWD